MDPVLVAFDGICTNFACVDDADDAESRGYMRDVEESGPITSDLSLYKELSSNLSCSDVDIYRIDVRYGTHVYEVRPYYRSKFEDGRICAAAGSSHSPLCTSTDFDEHVNHHVQERRFLLHDDEFISEVRTGLDATGLFVQNLFFRTNQGRTTFFGSKSSTTVRQQSPRSVISPLRESLKQVAAAIPDRQRHMRVIGFVHQYQWESLVGEYPVYLHRLGFVAYEISNWSFLKDFICLRELQRTGRAAINHVDSGLPCNEEDLKVLQAIFGRKRVKDTSVLYYVWTSLCDCPDDVFRNVLSFLAPNPFDSPRRRCYIDRRTKKK